MKTLITAIIASLLLPTFGIGQDADLESSKAKAAVREYERTLEDVDKEYQKQLKELEKSYQMKAELVRARLITNLTAALEEEARKINLEEANKIKAVVDEAKKYEVPTLEGLFGQAEKKPTKTVKTKTPKVRIPKTAVKFNGHHYAVVTKPMTPQGAKLYAESFGAHLVRIESSEENQFAAKLVQNFTGGGDGGFWIDGSDAVKEGDWFFSNGKPMVYWPNEAEPSNGSGQEHFVEIWKDGSWNDNWLHRQAFIIEWDE